VWSTHHDDLYRTLFAYTTTHRIQQCPPNDWSQFRMTDDKIIHPRCESSWVIDGRRRAGTRDDETVDSSFLVIDQDDGFGRLDKSLEVGSLHITRSGIRSMEARLIFHILRPLHVSQVEKLIEIESGSSANCHRLQHRILSSSRLGWLHCARQIVYLSLSEGHVGLPHALWSDMPQERIASGTVYRSASGTNKSMTPRLDRLQDLEGSRRGLSTHVDPEKAITKREKPAKHRVLGIDVGLLSEPQAFQDEDGHVALRPPTDELLRAWAMRRDDEEHPHRLTQEVQDAIIDRKEIVG